MTSVAQPDSNTASSEAFNEFEAGDYVVLQHKDDQEVIPGDFSTTSPCPPPSAPSIPTVSEAPAEAPAAAAPAPTVEQQQVPAKSEEEQEEAEAEAEEEEGDDEDGELESNEVSVDESAIESSDSEAFEAEIAQFEASESSADRSEADSPEPQPEDSSNPSVQVAGARSKPMSAESMLFVGSVLIMLMAFLLYRWIPAATPTPAQFQYYEDDDFAGSYSVHPPGRY